MNGETKISYCTTVKGRLEHLKQTLPKNLADNADYKNCEFVVLDYNSQDGLQQWLFENHKSDIDSGRVIYAKHPDAEYFSNAHSKNMAHRVAAEFGKFAGDKDHVLCNLDADNFTSKGFAQYIDDYFSKHEKGLMCSYFVLSKLHTILDGKKFQSGSTGRLVIREKDFLDIKGYNETELKGWGAEDSILKNRMIRRNLSVPKQIEQQYMSCIDHDNDLRIANYDEEGKKASMLDLNKKNLNTIERVGDRVFREIKYINYDIKRVGSFGEGKILLGLELQEKTIEPIASISSNLTTNPSLGYSR